MGVAVSAESEEYLPKAVEIRNRLARAIWDRRFDFQICGENVPDIETAIKTAVEAAESSIFIGDAGDNVTAGAPGDNTLFLKALIEADIPNALVSGLTDAENTQACFKAGLGERVTLTVGGKLDTKYCSPLEITGTIVNLYEPPDITLK